MTETVTKPRVLYLDIDDTLLVWTKDTHGFMAPRTAEFLTWANEHFEIRWLTMWCPSGVLEDQQAEELSYRSNYKIAKEDFLKITNSRKFVNLKTEGIDFEDPRPWVWVEDRILPKELLVLRDKKLEDRFYASNVSHNMVSLQSTWRKLAKQFDLPGAPELPYSMNIEMPIQLLSMDDIIAHYRTRNETRTIYSK